MGKTLGIIGAIASFLGLIISVLAWQFPQLRFVHPFIIRFIFGTATGVLLIMFFTGSLTVQGNQQQHQRPPFNGFDVPDAMARGAIRRLKIPDLLLSIHKKLVRSAGVKGKSEFEDHLY